MEPVRVPGAAILAAGVPHPARTGVAAAPGQVCQGVFASSSNLVSELVADTVHGQYVSWLNGIDFQLAA
jgi:hypothetical protein